MPIRLITFDVTNTIIRVFGGVGQNYACVAGRHGQTVDPDKLDSAFRTVFRQYNVKYPNFGVKHHMTPCMWWGRVVADCFRQSGCRNDEAIAKISTELYTHFAGGKGWEVLPGARETLLTIKESGIKLGVVSNFDERLETILQSLELRHYFDFVLASAVVGRMKPDNDMFNLALEAANVAAKETIHVGDNVVNDYLGARSAGIKAILLMDEDKPVPTSVDAKFVIRQLSEIHRYLE